MTVPALLDVNVLVALLDPLHTQPPFRRLATFDRRLVVDAVRGGRQALELLQG